MGGRPCRLLAGSHAYNDSESATRQVQRPCDDRATERYPRGCRTSCNRSGISSGRCPVVTLIELLRRAHTVRPLLWWLVALVIYVAAPIHRGWVLVLIVGLGVALTVTAMRLRDKVHRATDRASWAFDLAERIAYAVEDRVRHESALRAQQQPALAPAPMASYDPGALLSAIVAVLAAEGLPTNAGPALATCGQLLAWQNIAAHPGAPAPTAHGLMRALTPTAPRRHRAMSPVLLAQIVRVILTHDGVLPAQISIDAADTLIEASSCILYALAIAPDDGAGGLGAWPVLASIIDAAPLDAPTQHHGWSGR